MLTKQSSWWNTLREGTIPATQHRVPCTARGILCVKITCIVYLDHFSSSRRRHCCCSFCCYCFYSWREKLSCWRINHCGNWVSHIKAHAWLNCIQFAHVTIMMMMMMIILVVPGRGCLCDCAFAESETEIETETLQMFRPVPFSGQAAQEINELQKICYFV